MSYKSKTELIYEKIPKTNSSKALAKKLAKQNGFYKRNKEQFKSKIIDYSDSPSGKAYVGVNKSPFMPAANNGYGFQGVVIQNDERTLVQCHLTGEWMRKITDKYLRKHGTNIQEYKQTYGLFKTEGLVADETSLKLTKAALKNKRNISNNTTFKLGNKPNNQRNEAAMQFFNRHGTCPLQLQTRLYEFIICNRELPNQRNKGRLIYKALKRRFGSFGYALRENGLPYFERVGTNMKYQFPNGEVYEYNINQWHDREELYNRIINSCPKIRKFINN